MGTNVQKFATVDKMINGQLVRVAVQRDWYVYAFNVASIANGASATATINIQADADFVCERMMAFADIAGDVQTQSSQVLPLVTMMMTDSGSGRQLFNVALPIPTLCGENMTGQNLPFGRCFSANSNISALFTNYSNATTYANLYVNLYGYKEWTIGQPIPVGN